MSKEKRKYKHKYQIQIKIKAQILKRWEKRNPKRKAEFTGPPPSYIDLEQGLPDYQTATRYTQLYAMYDKFL